MATKTSEHTHDKHHVHVTPISTYLGVFATLMVLLAITYGVGFYSFGSFAMDRIITLTVALIKAGVIMNYFMHLNHSEKLVWVFALVGFFWIIILFLMTMGDYYARGTIPGVL